VMFKSSGESASVWAAWTAPAAGVLRLSTAGSAFDTLLAVYRSTAAVPVFSGTSWARVARNDDCDTGLTSCVALWVRAGGRYFIQVDGYDGGKGALAMRFEFASA
jgi:hypothetical protein